jgi:HemY protein
VTRLFSVLIVAVLVGLAAAWLADAGGVVTVIMGGYEIRTSAAIAAASVFVASLLLLVLLRLISLIMLGPANVSAFLIQRRAGKAYHALSRGLVAAAAGDAHETAQAARHAEKLIGKNPLALLLTAQAADLAKDQEHQHAACTAMLAHPETEFLATQRLADLALRRGNSEQALDFAMRAHALKPDSVTAAGTLFELRIRRGERAEAQALLEEALKAKRLTAESEARWREALASVEPREELGIANGGSAPA